MVKEVNLGVLEHILTLSQGRGKTREMLVMMGWSLRREAEHLLAPVECPTPTSSINHEYFSVEL